MSPIVAAPLSALIAPGPTELDEAVAEMHARVDRMDAVGDALARVQNAWGERMATGTPTDPCTDPAAASLAARSRVLGDAWRDGVQSSRAQLDRLERLWAAPTVVPLLDDADHDTADAFRATVDRHVRSWSEAAAWQSRIVEPAVRKCPDLALVPVEGLPYAGAPARRDDPVRVAVIAVGGGLICPAALPADGRVVVTGGTACWDAGDACSCALEPVLPAAVLGPPSGQPP